MFFETNNLDDCNNPKTDHFQTEAHTQSCLKSERNYPSNENQPSTNSIQKVDAATMTDPLQIDFNLNLEFLAKHGLPYVFKHDKFSNNVSSCNSEESKAIQKFETKREKNNGSVEYNCPECSLSFEDEDSMEKHLEAHKAELYICDVCRSSFKNEELLNKHKQIHTIRKRSKNQVCSVCSKAFYRKDHLQKHLLSHNVGTKRVQSNQDTNRQEEQGLSTFALIMRQVVKPPFSNLRS